MTDHEKEQAAKKHFNDFGKTRAFGNLEHCYYEGYLKGHEDAWKRMEFYLHKHTENQNSGEKWLTNNEALQVLRVSKRTLQKYRDDGWISYSQISGKLYYKLSEINNMLEKYMQNPLKNKR